MDVLTTDVIAMKSTAFVNLEHVQAMNLELDSIKTLIEDAEK